MKLERIIIAAVIALLFVSSCKKVDDPTGESVGTLKDTTTGACLPVIVNGIFMVDSVLNNDNYVDVQANVSVGGTFEIKSDTVNGFSFRKSGTFSAGLNVIRLYASGKPLATGVHTFHITYGLSSCSFTITVYGTGPGSGTALYTLGGSPGNCSITSITGNYVVGQAMTAANKVEMAVNVTTPGTYIITGVVINGVSFNASGVFANPGLQSIFLAASGTPVAAGSFTYPVTNSTTSCSFPITYTTTITNATFALSGAPNNCTGAAVIGSYIVGSPLTGSNIAVINVNVTSPGNYNITTPVVNGISFSAAGVFNLNGPQQVTLQGTGTPLVANTSSLPVSGGGNTCNLSVTVNPVPGPAVYTMDCVGMTVNGTYYVGSVLNASNTISLPVNVTTAGTYTITSTPAVNGITFSKTGIFTATGPQTIVLTGTGTPAAAGAFNYTITGASGTCPFSITAVTGTPGIYSCKIDGVFTDFADRAHAEIDDMGQPYLYLTGYTGPPNGGTVPHFQIFITKNDHSTVGTGTYNENGLLLPNGYRIEIDYTVQNPDLSVTIWNTSSNTFPPPHPPFTIIVTSVTATRVIGTFSGQLTNTLQGSTMLKTITEGVFNLPIQ
jgi:hypothetical protein